jgi:pimeloyl-ACP methyl ester carboxylesterase
MHVKRSFSNFPNSYALLSGKEETKTAVFFVHGFAGNAHSTWIDFQGMVDTGEEAARWKCVDLYFYDYQTTTANLLVQTDGFLKFLKANFPEPRIDLRPHPILAASMGVNGTLLPLAHRYDSLTLVGHSLGGVIVRQAVLSLDAEFQAFETLRAENPVETLSHVELSQALAADVKLFAPAIFGFDPSHFAGFLYNFAREFPILSHLLRVTRTSNAAIKELAAGAPRLAELRRRTEDLAKKTNWRALRASILFGAMEDIVYMERYDCDDQIRIAESHDHTSVCKPTQDYRIPLEFVYGKPKSVSA